MGQPAPPHGVANVTHLLTVAFCFWLDVLMSMLHCAHVPLEDAVSTTAHEVHVHNARATETALA